MYVRFGGEYLETDYLINNTALGTYPTGRTRRTGTLLGKGMSFDEVMAELSGLTLESVVIAKRAAQAVYKLVERGIATKEQFPLLLHVDEIITDNKPVNIPFKAFETETVL